jgi:hypothetical protein
VLELEIPTVVALTPGIELLLQHHLLLFPLKEFIEFA